MLLLFLKGFAVLLLLIALFFCVWFQYHIDAFRYLLYSKDKKWAHTPDPQEMKRKKHGSLSTKTKTLYFIRHGESSWNVTFNRNKLFFLPSLLYAIVKEVTLIFTQKDSWFYDAPLCDTGVKQAESVQSFLRENAGDEDVEAILHNRDSLLVCSNLRRCISTALIALEDRLSEFEDRVVIHPALQEITFNPDGLSITAPLQQPQPSWFDKTVKDHRMTKLYVRNVDASFNTGNKDITSNGIKRLTAFNNWVFDRPEDTIVISGHSLWFKSYFSEFLPHSFTHVSKKKKMQNGAVVRVVVEEHTTTSGERFVMIQPDSIKEVHYGFKK